MKKKVKFSEEKLVSLITNILTETLEQEGIDVTANREVTMTDMHEERVNTSLVANPTCTKDIIPNIEVWSLFQRLSHDRGDGNPLLYALKNEKHYRLTNPKMVYTRIEKLVEKFITKHNSINTTIAVPSTNRLNKYLIGLIKSKNKGIMVIDNLLVKMTIEEVDDYVFDENSTFRKVYGKDFEQKYEIFQHYCSRMPYRDKNGKEKNDFRLHLIEDMEMRQIINNTIKINNQFYGSYLSAINNKDILIIDDSITTGQSIKEATKIIADCYEPKSITILTLMSPLYTNDGSNLKNI